MYLEGRWCVAEDFLVPPLGAEARGGSQVSFTSEVPLSGSSSCRYVICAGGGGSLYSSITQSRIRRSMSSRWRPCLNRKSRNHLNKCDSREGSWFILPLWEISASRWFLKIRLKYWITRTNDPLSLLLRDKWRQVRQRRCNVDRRVSAVYLKSEK